jgi:thioredoxin 1
MKENKELIVFSAAWCGNCKPYKAMLADTDVEVSKIDIIDVDEEPALSAQYQIRSVPTTILVKDGVVHNRKTGAMTKEQLTAFINS